MEGTDAGVGNHEVVGVVVVAGIVEQVGIWN